MAFKSHCTYHVTATKKMANGPHVFRADTETLCTEELNMNNKPFYREHVVIELKQKNLGDLVVTFQEGKFHIFQQYDAAQTTSGLAWEFVSKHLTLTEAMTNVGNIIVTNCETEFYVKKS